MGIALSATVRFLSPLSVVIAHLRPLMAPPVARYRLTLPPVFYGQHGHAVPQAHMPRHTTKRLPLRVVRIVDTGHTPTSAGRMTISGSMADVCAELDRMVQAEATRH